MIDHLSPSSLDQYLRCGEAWRLDRIEKIKPAKAQPLIVGIAVHEVVEGLNRARKAGKAPILAEAASRLAKDTVQGFFVESDIELSEGQMKDEALESCKQKAERLTALFYHDVLPRLGTPTLVEHEIKIEPLDSDLPPITCRIDWAEGDVVFDLKTSSKSWTTDQAAGDEQMTLYYLALMTMGIKARAIKIVTLVDTKKPKAEIIETVRKDEDVFALLEKYRAAWRGIKAGVFMPASYRGWWCGKNCGYVANCRYVNRSK